MLVSMPGRARTGQRGALARPDGADQRGDPARRQAERTVPERPILGPILAVLLAQLLGLQRNVTLAVHAMSSWTLRRQFRRGCYGPCRCQWRAQARQVLPDCSPRLWLWLCVLCPVS